MVLPWIILLQKTIKTNKTISKRYYIVETCLRELLLLFMLISEAFSLLSPL